MKRYFHSELEHLRHKLILIGEKAVEAAHLAIEGFLESDLDKVNFALKLDDEIDALELEIDRDAVRYTILRGPVSADMRLIFVAIKASQDLERAGDEAHSIGKKTRSILSRDGKVSELGHIEEMRKIALEMMKDAITCFVEEDLELAEAIFERDKAVDRLHKANFNLLSKAMGTTDTEAATKFETILISKSIERIGDHAKNLAGDVIYLLKGE